MIISRKIGSFDPSSFRDHYQEALKELIEAKLKGLPLKGGPEAPPAPVLDLMAALKQSLAQETRGAVTAKPKRRAADRRQSSLLLPLSRKGGKQPRSAIAEPTSRRRSGSRRR